MQPQSLMSVTKFMTFQQQQQQQEQQQHNCNCCCCCCLMLLLLLLLLGLRNSHTSTGERKTNINRSPQLPLLTPPSGCYPAPRPLSSNTLKCQI